MYEAACPTELRQLSISRSKLGWCASKKSRWATLRVLVDLFFNTGTYKLCCFGMWCPECPTRLEIRILGHAHIIDRFLKARCEEKQYNITVSAAVQPGRYETQVSMLYLLTWKKSKTFSFHWKKFTLVIFLFFIVYTSWSKHLLSFTKSTSLKNIISHFFSVCKVHRFFVNDSRLHARRNYLGHITVNGNDNSFLLACL